MIACWTELGQGGSFACDRFSKECAGLTATGAGFGAADRQLSVGAGISGMRVDDLAASLRVTSCHGDDGACRWAARWNAVGPCR